MKASRRRLMKLRQIVRRFRRFMCMTGVHQFTDGVERCVAPGCRAPRSNRVRRLHADDRRAGDVTRKRRRALYAASAIAAMVGVSVAACTTAATFSDRDVRLVPSGATLYVLARDSDVSRNFCSSLGGDVALAEGRSFAAGAMHPGRVMGCYTMRHIIVCAENDSACFAHEERHRDRGRFVSYGHLE
jgi:hypothetical protein